MTVKDVMSYPFVGERTFFYICDEECILLACSFRTRSQIRRFWQSDVKSFSWDDSNELCITIRED